MALLFGLLPRDIGALTVRQLRQYHRHIEARLTPDDPSDEAVT